MKKKEWAKKIDDLRYLFGYKNLFFKAICGKPRRAVILQIILDNPEITVPDIRGIYLGSQGKVLSSATVWSDLMAMRSLSLIEKIKKPRKIARYRATDVLDLILQLAVFLKEKEIARLEDEMAKEEKKRGLKSG